MKNNSLETRKIFSSFFEPSAVAVIGSFRESIFGGYVVVKSLLKSGYAGKIFPVNPGYKSVLNLRVYGSLEEIPDPVELAILIINAKNVIRVIRQCASQGIRAVIVVADGFAERNQEGAKLQREMVKTARELGVRIIGPNTAGVLNAWSGFNPCPYDAGYYKLKRGPVAICSQ
ncbi:MAG: CoA-binding protein, partial [Deltaproteobacteria bacterium]|nr:CoA-binding protein [Deltaproteobacteria bacterium]